MILAIDPGNIESGYVFTTDNLEVIECGKINNDELIEKIERFYFYDSSNKTQIAIEMVASYGMAVGCTVFETCIWIGRFMQKIIDLDNEGYKNIKCIYRKDEKMNLCNSMKAKDSNIVQALIDRFAPNTPNKGKGTKKEPGWFYGFKKDIWQAYAVAVTYHDLYLKGGNNND